jgi:hypothetical protein
MRSFLAVLLVVALAVPWRAAAEEVIYPRMVRRPGQVCLQTLGEGGQVVERCRAEGADWNDAEAPRAAPPKPEAETIAEFRPDPPPERQPIREDPTGVALRDAEDSSNAGSYLTGGFVGGCLLGVLGCGGVTVLGLASDPVPPNSGRFATEEDERLYRETYQSKVRRKRVFNAVIGGLLGMAVTGAVVYAIVSAEGGIDR